MPAATRTLAVFALMLLLTSLIGCGESDPPGTKSEKLNTAPKVEPEVPQPVDRSDGSAENQTDTPTNTDETVTIDVPGMTFAAPASWKQKEKPFVNDAEFAIPGSGGDVRLTIMKAGGPKDANITRWVGQFQQAAGDEPSISEIDVDGKTTAMVDVRGTYRDIRPGQGSKENYRMIGFIIPFSASDSYFVKATGPQPSVAEHVEAIQQFVKTGKQK